MATASMSDRRRALSALAADRTNAGASGRFWKRAVAAIVMLALITLVVMWFLGCFSTPQAVAEVRQLVDQQVAELERAGRGEVPFDTGAGMGAVMAKMRDVPREYREQVGQQMGRLFEARERAEMRSYFLLSPDKRKAEIDRRIKSEEDRRKAWQADRARREQERGDGRQASANGDRGGQPGGRGPGGGGPGGGGGGPGGGGPGSGRRGGTEESRNERSKQRLDHSTPEQRAQQTEYRRAVEERRKELGLSPGRRG